MKTLLLSLGYTVCPSWTHGENNCLVDSVFRALEEVDLMHEATPAVRAATARAVRRHLEEHHGVSAAGFPFLEHDRHCSAICDHLRAAHHDLWHDHVDPATVALTIIVFDRHNRRIVHNEDGTTDEIVETNPVHSPEAPGKEKLREEMLHLYCCTHNSGEGYHYEWVQTVPPNDV